MKGVKGTDGVSFCWQDKSRLRLIREKLKDKERCAALVVYLVLTNIASDEEDSRFTTYRKVIASMAGIGRDRVTKALGHLEALGLIKLSAQTRGKDGKFVALHITLTKGKMEGEAVGTTSPRTIAANPSRSESHVEANDIFTSASESQSSRDGLPVAGNLAYSAESNLVEKRVVVTCARETEMVPSLPADIQESLESSVSPFVPPNIVLAFASFVADHGYENVRTAIREAREHLVGRTGFTKYVRSVLENQQKTGYTWEPRPTPPRRNTRVTDLSHIPVR